MAVAGLLVSTVTLLFGHVIALVPEFHRHVGSSQDTLHLDELLRGLGDVT